MSLPLVLAVGMTMDYSLATSAKSQMQGALDAAAFAALTMPDTTTLSDRNSTLQKVYGASGGEGTATIDGDIVTGAMGASLTAISTYNMPTNFMGLIGASQIGISSASAVTKPIKLSTARFQLNQVRGAWDKTISLMGRANGTTTYSALLKMVYVATSGGYGTTTLKTPNKSGGWTDTLKIACSSMTSCTKTIYVGDGTAQADMSGMDDVYMQMDISGRWWWWYSTPTVTYKTSDPWTWEMMFQDGKQMPKDEPVDLLKMVGCNSNWKEQRWEDGGGYQGTTPWDGTDFRYSIKGGCSTNGTTVRLTN